MESGSFRHLRSQCSMPWPLVSHCPQQVMLRLQTSKRVQKYNPTMWHSRKNMEMLVWHYWRSCCQFVQNLPLVKVNKNTTHYGDFFFISLLTVRLPTLSLNQISVTELLTPNWELPSQTNKDQFPLVTCLFFYSDHLFTPTWCFPMSTSSLFWSNQQSQSIWTSETPWGEKLQYSPSDSFKGCHFPGRGDGFISWMRQQFYKGRRPNLNVYGGWIYGLDMAAGLQGRAGLGIWHRYFIIICPATQGL
jgi:hypothetical protein